MIKRVLLAVVMSYYLDVSQQLCQLSKSCQRSGGSCFSAADVLGKALINYLDLSEFLHLSSCSVDVFIF